MFENNLLAWVNIKEIILFRILQKYPFFPKIEEILISEDEVLPKFPCFRKLYIIMELGKCSLANILSENK